MTVEIEGEVKKAGKPKVKDDYYGTSIKYFLEVEDDEGQRYKTMVELEDRDHEERQAWNYEGVGDRVRYTVQKTKNEDEDGAIWTTSCTLKREFERVTTDGEDHYEKIKEKERQEFKEEQKEKRKMRKLENEAYKEKRQREKEARLEKGEYCGPPREERESMRWKSAVNKIEEAGFETRRADRGKLELPNGEGRLHIIDAGYKAVQFVLDKEWLKVVAFGNLRGEDVITVKVIE